MDSIQAPNHNKSIAAGGGALGGGTIGVVFVAFLHYRYGIVLGPEMSTAVGGLAAAAFGTVGAFLAPIFTAGQQALVRHLNDQDREQAEEVIAAVQTASVNRGGPEK